jgi:L-cysteine desulfidase
MNLENLFQSILKPALGCTEPVAVAMAVGASVQAAAGWTVGVHDLPVGELAAPDIRDITVRVTPSVFKNAFAIPIPNARGEKGIYVAAALGAFCNPNLELELFGGLDDAAVDKARWLIDHGRVAVTIGENLPPTDLYIEAVTRFQLGPELLSGTCIIQDRHTHIVRLRAGERVTYRDMPEEPGRRPVDPDLEALRLMKLGEITALVERLPESVCAMILRTIALNMRACEAGLAEPLGLGAGYLGAGGKNEGAVDLSHYVSSVAAAGSDARMSGYPLEVMSAAGSGNQGITATIPVVAWARSEGLAEDRLIRAVALAHLVTMHITLHVGYLSALCGVAIKAGIGAACGITYAMGGDAAAIGRAVKIMAATLSGMICDGAKPGCALKVSSSADMATRAAQMAMQRMEVSADEGIVAPTPEATIRNLAELSRSMQLVDRKIIEIMDDKARS